MCEVIESVSYFRENRDNIGLVKYCTLGNPSCYQDCVQSVQTQSHGSGQFVSIPILICPLPPLTPRFLTAVVLPLSKCDPLPSHAPCFKALPGFQLQYSTSNSEMWVKLLSGIIYHWKFQELCVLVKSYTDKPAPA